MVFFLTFLVLTTIVLPMIKVSETGRLVVALAFALTLIFGALATICHRVVVCFVIGLALSTLAIDLIRELSPAHSRPALASTLQLTCALILVLMTLKRTFRPGPVTIYRVIGGIAGYLLIGYTWMFAYQLVVQQIPGAIHFEPGIVDTLPGRSGQLVYFSFTTLTTVGYGDVHPAHPAVRSLAVAEALVGQLYVAILIASLVGMALQTKSGGEKSQPQLLQHPGEIRRE